MAWRHKKTKQSRRERMSKRAPRRYHRRRDGPAHTCTHPHAQDATLPLSPSHTRRNRGERERARSRTTRTKRNKTEQQQEKEKTEQRKTAGEVTRGCFGPPRREPSPAVLPAPSPRHSPSVRRPPSWWRHRLPPPCHPCHHPESPGCC